MPKPGLLVELQRRHVWRVAIAYGVVSWLLIQIATQVFPFFSIPDWVVRLLVLLVVLGFLPALVLAWVYELTPEGIRRTESADSPDARPADQQRRVGRRLNAIILAVLVLLVLVLGWRELERGRPPAVPQVAGASEAAVAGRAMSAVSGELQQRSIAVLPFENLSDDHQNDYFVAGIQDLILARLSDIGDLRVISRGSTARYGSQPGDLRLVARQLGIASVVEGSVQKSGNRVLITVKLVDALQDRHLWGQDYARTLDDIFGVEGEVAEKIARALSARLSPEETRRLAAIPTANQFAYDLYLRAEYQANRGAMSYDSARLKEALALYRQAIDEDPRFARALARLSCMESLLAWFGGGGLDVADLNRRAQVDADRALELAGDLAAARLAVGYSAYWGRGDFTAALEAFDAALALSPNDADALVAKSRVQRRQGRFTDAIATSGEAFALDPRNSSLADEIGTTHAMVNRFEDAGRWFERALALDADNLTARIEYSNAILFASGDLARALDMASGEQPMVRLQRVTLLTYGRDYAGALAVLEGVPDTPDNFNVINGSKAMRRAELLHLAGNDAAAAPLYRAALAEARRQLDVQQGINLALVWRNVASAELGLGQIGPALEAIGRSTAITIESGDQVYGPGLLGVSAMLYAQAGRADLAVPLMEQALESPGLGSYYSATMLWLDPVWDAIRDDPRFQALLQRYVQYRPALLGRADAEAEAAGRMCRLSQAPGGSGRCPPVRRPQPAASSGRTWLAMAK